MITIPEPPPTQQFVLELRELYGGEAHYRIPEGEATLTVNEETFIGLGRPGQVILTVAEYPRPC